MRKLLTTTALAVALAGPALAQDATEGFVTTTEATDHYGSDLIGKRLYVSETEIDASAGMAADAEQDWEDVGEINDLLIGEDGEVKAVLLDIGGFLGIGEKTVAVSMDQLHFMSESDDPEDSFIVIQGSQDMLENAPAFEELDDAMNQAANDTGAALNEAADDTAAAADAAGDEIEKAAENTAAAVDEAAQDVEETADAAGAEVQQEADEMASGTAWDAPAIERDGYETVASQDLTAEMLEGANIYGADEDDIGSVADLVVTADGVIDKAIVDVGGFLGIGAHRIAIDFDELQVIRDPDMGNVEIHVSATREQLEERAEYNG